jgi:hypothetical protein
LALKSRAAAEKADEFLAIVGVKALVIGVQQQDPHGPQTAIRKP